MSAMDAWKHSEFLCCNYVLNGLVDALYYVYCKITTPKELWELLERKYKTEDSGTKKFMVARFLDYKMVDEKMVISQVQELQVIISDIHAEGMVLSETFQVTSMVEKLPQSWANMVEHGQSSKSNKVFKKGKGKEKSVNLGPKKGGVVKKKFKDKCYNCGENSHLTQSCKARATMVDDDSMPLVAMITEALEMIAEVNIAGDKPQSWYVDMGATRHVCGDKNLFNTFTEVKGDPKLYMGNKATADIKGEGDVILKMTSGKELTLSNTLYVPEIRKNLVSGWLLNKFGFRLCIESDKVVLTKKGMFVGKGYALNAMFKLSVMVVKKNMNDKASTSSYMLELNYNIDWHVHLDPKAKVRVFCEEAVRAYLSSTHEDEPAYLPSTQEEDPAYLSSTHKDGHAYLSSTHEEGTAYLSSTHEAKSANLLSTQEQGSAHLLSAQIGSDVVGPCLGQPKLTYQNEMARRGNRRRGGGRIGGRTGGQNGGRGRTPARQEYSEEGKVREAIAREFTELMKTSLPGLLAEALKKVNGEGGSNTAVDTPNTEAINAPLNLGCDYKSFKACDPPVLTGKKDAVATFDWVIRMEAAIRLSECRTDQFVKFAANSLRDEASHWWEGVRQAKGSEVVDEMMWADLKTLVIKNFCPRNEIEKVEREFLGLKAGSMTHWQYTTRFNELACLVPHLVTTEERKIVFYIHGLSDQVRTYVKANAPTTYDSVVELSGVGGKLFGARDKQARVGEATVYGRCGVRHAGECRLGSNLCFKCGKTGHYSRNCPQGFKCYNCGESGHMSRECTKPRMGQAGKGKGPEKTEERPRAKTRAYALTQEQARADPDVASGMYVLDNTFVSVLFDSGASKIFISATFCKRVKYTVSKLERAFSVEISEGRTVRVTDVVDNSTIKIEGHRFPVRLFVMVLGGFDVVLGMDWLTANEAQIICKRKIIRLKAPDGSNVEVFRDRVAPMPNVISMIKAADYLRRGCEAYLVYVIDECKEMKELDDVPMVLEYPEVFLEDLPGIPPDREIEFRIDLVPDAQPMSYLRRDLSNRASRHGVLRCCL
ncbi:hypothetical protein L1987_21010 [Smallanthus sonchifolius]|uniref:Uncharacterized protein n=1 Tax=Smallanthus sonchifolius TaxID=185202 RepID=A0ACB9ITF3_9ASTR|nr:hypothetical protein L1987_21010 [Smallanthus sonchifolius]